MCLHAPRIETPFLFSMGAYPYYTFWTTYIYGTGNCLGVGFAGWILQDWFIKSLSLKISNNLESVRRYLCLPYLFRGKGRWVIIRRVEGRAIHILMHHDGETHRSWYWFSWLWLSERGGRCCFTQWRRVLVASCLLLTLQPNSLLQSKSKDSLKITFKLKIKIKVELIKLTRNLIWQQSKKSPLITKLITFLVSHSLLFLIDNVITLS